MTTLTLSAIPLSARSASERQKLRDRPKPMMASAKTPTASEHRAPRPLERRPVREEDPHRDGARGRRGAEQPQALRPDVQDLRGEHRQQRLGAAEEDGEEVEREGAEDRVLALHEAQPGEQLVEHRRVAGEGARLRACSAPCRKPPSATSMSSAATPYAATAPAKP